MTPEEDLKTLNDALAKAPPKPGYKTTEFYVSLAAMAVGAFLASGALPDSHPAVKIAGVVAMLLSAMGYQVQRTTAKG